MMMAILRTMLDLARIRWEHRAAEWGEQALDDTLRSDFGLPPRPAGHLRAKRRDWC